MGLHFSVRRYVTLICLCLLLVHNAKAQSIEEYVKQNTTAIASVQPEFADDSDLQVIGKAIGNAQLVLLGEQDHGDAPTFLAKTRLIKYLHQKKGFDVLAFESDFFLNQGWDQLQKTDLAIDTFLKKNIFPVWTFCDACDELFYNYIPSTYNTNQPLTISGFDNQMILQYARQNLSRQLDSVLRKRDLPITRQTGYSSRILPLIDSLPGWSLSSVKHDDSLRMLEGWLWQMRSELKEKISDDFWLRVVDNLIAETGEFQSRSKENSYVRDSQMAMNIKWLSEIKYPGKKILVWAANEHISKWKNTIRGGDIKNNKTMGGFLAGDSVVNAKMYVLGFTSYQGTAGRIFVKPYPIPKARANGFSNWIYSGLHYPYAFTDFTLYNQNFSEKPSFFMSGFGHQETKAAWTDLFDGVFYIQDMYPCRNTYHSTK